ncbi:autophagy protein 5 [Blomia tropicalis]|nr:autophagy protein 5 [Blomia tropicalis]
MAEDGEVLRQIWDSHIPVSFHLSVNDLQSIKNPEPYYSMVPRLSYFSLVIDKVIVYFSQFIDGTTTSSSNLWLDFLGVPLKLNYPIGLLYDLHASDIELPWSITVNFDRFPSDEIVRCNTRSTMEMAYMYSLKEADALKHRNPIINTMQKKDHNQLWNGLINYKFEQFWSINRRLMTPDLLKESSSNATETNVQSNIDQSNNNIVSELFRNIPFRLYITSQSDSPIFVQKLIRPKTETGEYAQLGHLVAQVMREDVEKLSKKYRFVIHGIEPPLNTPLQWLSEHLSYLDNFLHISAIERQKA